MNKSSILLVVFVLVLCAVDHAQMLDTLWSKSIVDSCSPFPLGSHLVPLNDGGCVTTFTTELVKDSATTVYHSTALLYRFGPEFTLMWKVQFGEYYPAHLSSFRQNQEVEEDVTCVVELDNGSLIVFAIMAGDGAIDSTYAACISSAGQKLWSKVIPQMAMQAIKGTDYVDLLMNFSTTQKHAIRRYDSNISACSAVSFGTDTTLNPRSFASTGQGGHVFGGYRRIGGKDSVVVWRVDPAGTIQWRKTLGESPVVESPQVLTDDADRTFYSVNKSVVDTGVLVSADAAGNTNWTRQNPYLTGWPEDYNMCNLGADEIMISEHSYEAFSHVPTKSLVALSVYDKSTGRDRTTVWTSSIPYVNSFDVAPASNGKILGLSSGPYFAAKPGGTLLRFDWNNPPVFQTKPGDLPSRIEQDRVSEFQIVATDDFPDDKVRYSVQCAGISECVIDSITGTLTLSPKSEGDTGQKAITVFAKDRCGQSDTLSLLIEVGPDPLQVFGPGGANQLRARKPAPCALYDLRGRFLGMSKGKFDAIHLKAGVIVVKGPAGSRLVVLPGKTGRQATIQ